MGFQFSLVRFCVCVPSGLEAIPKRWLVQRSGDEDEELIQNHRKRQDIPIFTHPGYIWKLHQTLSYSVFTKLKSAPHLWNAHVFSHIYWAHSWASMWASMGWWMIMLVLILSILSIAISVKTAKVGVDCVDWCSPPYKCRINPHSPWSNHVKSWLNHEKTTVSCWLSRSFAG